MCDRRTEAETDIETETETKIKIETDLGERERNLGKCLDSGEKPRMQPYV